MTNTTLARTDPHLTTRRSRRYRLQQWWAPRSIRAGARQCLHQADGSDGATLGVTASGAVHVAGVKHCGSGWACHVCAPIVGERRAGEIDAGVSHLLLAGYVVMFVTATVRHHRKMSLRDSQGLLQAAWRSTHSGGAFTRWKAAHGYAGAIKALEHTWSLANGWHPHIHALMVFKPGTTPAQVDRQLQAHGRRFASFVAARGGQTLVRGNTAPGWVVKPVVLTDRGVTGLAGYLTKVAGGWGAGLELARTDLKSGKLRSSITPWDMAELAFAGSRDHLSLWAEYEAATLGRSRVQWSRGLRELAGLDAELTDEQIANLPPREAFVATVHIPALLWRQLVRSGLLGQFIDRFAQLHAPPPDG